MSNPIAPFSVPNEGEKVSWDGDQKMDGNGVLYGTHHGVQAGRDRPTANAGLAITDMYVWEEL